MLKKKTVLRFILGLKIRQLRSRRDMSLKELAEAADLSISYLNEIENGKKYPKIEKLAAIAQGLAVELGDLVSFKTGRNLHPLLKFLESDMVSKVPLELFGLTESDVVDLMGHEPEKFASFVLTVLQISRAFDMKLEDVYTAALRSLIEANENYFPELEKLAKKIRHEWSLNDTFKYADLLKVISEKYGYRINETALANPKLADEEKCLIKRNGEKTIYFNPRLNEQQRVYFLAKELGQLHIDQEGFSEEASLNALLLNFKTSYFAGSLLLDEKSFSKDIKNFFSSPIFTPELFLSLIDKYKVPPEVFFQRLTQVLPSAFKVNELFFLGVCSDLKKGEAYSIEHELHLAQLHSPHGVRMYENYCRRWVAIKSIKQLRASKKNDLEIVAQISVVNDEVEYFSLSVAAYSPINNDLAESFTIGFLVNTELKNVIKFLNDKSLNRISIGQTCERCPKADCLDRVAPASVYQKEILKNEKAKLMLDLIS